MFVSARGGVAAMLNLAPHLHGSTPARQNGYELKHIFRYDHDFGGFALVLEPDWFPTEKPSPSGLLPDYNPPDAFRIIARSSTGTQWLLSWHLRDTKSWPAEGVEPGRYLFVGLPRGYPTGYRYMDVTLRDTKGRTARWRLNRLQAMRHAIAPPVQTVNIIRHQGVTIEASAVWSYSNSRADIAWRTESRIRAYAAPQPGIRWELVEGGSNSEWESHGVRIFTGNERGSVLKSIPAKKSDGGSVSVGETHFPPDNRYCRMWAQLLKYEKTNYGAERLVETVPLVFTIPIADLGPLEKRYPSPKK